MKREFSLIDRAAKAVCFLSMLYAVSVSLTRWIPDLLFNGPTDYGSGAILNQALRLLEFENIYRSDLVAPPWTVSNYPPLFYLLQLPGLYWLGADFRVARFISVAAVFASAYLVGRLCLAVSRDRLAALVAGITFLSLPMVLIWGILGRVDSVALCLTLIGLNLALDAIRRDKSLIPASIAIIAAAYTRQTCLLFGPLVVSLWLSQAGRYRDLVKFLGVLFAFVAALGAILVILTGGGFLTHVVLANLNPLKLSALSLTVHLIAIWVPIMVGASCAVLILPTFRPVRHLVLPLLIAGVISASLFAKRGSDVNYLFELGAAMSVAMAAFVARMSMKGTISRAFAMCLAAANLIWMVQFAPFSGSKGFESARFQQVSQLIEVVKRAPDPILSDDYLGLELLRGGQIFFQPFERTQLVKSGHWDQTPLLQMITAKEFSLILMNESRPDLIESRWTPEMRSAIASSYMKSEQIGKMSVYLPRRTMMENF
ncbi:MAG: hypothetical protein DCC75_08095 [Proteobacteria bacterium]|nr:MAG: hypothetical protein DCC75_08095 [Pseudomonadota bacterium]